VAELRDYQQETIDDFERLVAADARSVLVTAPTGSGKTVIVFALVASALPAGQRILVA
jgi:superfamily II DNA or RNA helicase